MRFAQLDPQCAGQTEQLRYLAALPGHRQVKVITGQRSGTDDIFGELHPLTLGLTMLIADDHFSFAAVGNSQVEVQFGAVKSERLGQEFAAVFATVEGDEAVAPPGRDPKSVA